MERAVDPTVAYGGPGPARSWMPLLAMCGVYFAFGATIGAMAPLVDEISEDLELSRTAMGSILGAWALIYVFSSVPAGAAVDRLGLRRALAIGGLSVCASLILRAVASGGVTLFAAVAVFGTGGPLVSVSAPKLIATLFAEDARRIPTGLTAAAPTLGTTSTLALTNPILLPLADGSWRVVLLSLAALSAVITMLWWRASFALEPIDTERPVTDRATIARLLGVRSLRWILAIAVCFFFIGHATNAWMPEILVDSGRSDDSAGFLAAMMLAAGILGTLTISRLVPVARRASALVALSVIIAGCLAVLTVAPVGLLIPTLALLGFSRSGFIPLLFLEIMNDERIPLEQIGAATGLFFAIGEIGGFSGPLSVGVLADWSGDFRSATLVLAAISLCSAAAAWALGRSTASRM